MRSCAPLSSYKYYTYIQVVSSDVDEYLLCSRCSHLLRTILKHSLYGLNVFHFQLLYSILSTLNKPFAPWDVFLRVHAKHAAGSTVCYRKLLFNFTSNSPYAVFIMIGRSCGARRLVDPFIILCWLMI